MSSERGRHAGVGRGLIAEQRTFYDLRAPDFGDATKPDRVGRSSLDSGVLRSVIDEFNPRGEVLELACGTGWLTRELARHTDSLTAVDASRGMIERARNEIDSDAVRFVQADIFDWTPDRAYDAVFFANWLSHVPPPRFDDFWELVARCTKPHDRSASLTKTIARSATITLSTAVECLSLAVGSATDGPAVS